MDTVDVLVVVLVVVADPGALSGGHRWYMRGRAVDTAGLGCVHGATLASTEGL